MKREARNLCGRGSRGTLGISYGEDSGIAKEERGKRGGGKKEGERRLGVSSHHAGFLAGRFTRKKRGRGEKGGGRPMAASLFCIFIYCRWAEGRGGGVDRA